MKKLNLFLLVAAIGFSFSTMAQVTFGPKLGMNLAKYAFDFKESDNETDLKLRLAPIVGFAVNIQFNEAFALQSGLFFSGKGASIDLEKTIGSDANPDGYARFSTGYLELPVNLAYGFPVGDNQIQVFAGPYLAYGITGKYIKKYTYEYMGQEKEDDETIDIKFKSTIDESDDDDVHYQTALDFGLNFGLGFKTGPVLINAGYGMGFANLTPKWSGEGDYTRDDEKYTNRIINFSVSYFIGGE